jgi:hypothetical protein
MDENRINALASEIVDRNMGDLLVPGLGVKYGKETLTDKRLAMNLDAFRQRYGITIFLEDQADIELDRRKWKTDALFSDAQFFKTLQCFLYQCAEGDVDEKPLYKTLEAVKDLLAPFIQQESPEYEAAAWG